MNVILSKWSNEFDDCVIPNSQTRHTHTQSHKYTFKLTTFKRLHQNEFNLFGLFRFSSSPLLNIYFLKFHSNSFKLICLKTYTHSAPMKSFHSKQIIENRVCVCVSIYACEQTCDSKGKGKFIKKRVKYFFHWMSGFVSHLIETFKYDMRFDKFKIPKENKHKNIFLTLRRTPFCLTIVQNMAHIRITWN